MDHLLSRRHWEWHFDAHSKVETLLRQSWHLLYYTLDVKKTPLARGVFLALRILGDPSLFFCSLEFCIRTVLTCVLRLVYLCLCS